MQSKASGRQSQGCVVGTWMQDAVGSGCTIVCRVAKKGLRQLHWQGSSPQRRATTSTYKKVSTVFCCDAHYSAFLVPLHSCCRCCRRIHIAVFCRIELGLLPTAVARKKKCDATCYYNMRLYFAAYSSSMKRYNGKPYEPFNYAGQK